MLFLLFDAYQRTIGTLLPVNLIVCGLFVYVIVLQRHTKELCKDSQRENVMTVLKSDFDVFNALEVDDSMQKTINSMKKCGRQNFSEVELLGYNKVSTR